VAGEVADMFLMLMTKSLGWKMDSGGSDPWAKMLAERGLSRPMPYGPSWSLGQLREVLVAAVVTAGHDPRQLTASLCDILANAVVTQESAVAALEQEEQTLVDQMLRERAAAITSPAFAEGGTLENVARAENHLSRQLDRVLARLERLQTRRLGTPSIAQWIGDLQLGLSAATGSGTGFVLPNGGRRANRGAEKVTEEGVSGTDGEPGPRGER
jgi:hypothetical protein